VDVGVGVIFRGTETEQRREMTVDDKSEVQLLYGRTSDTTVLKDGQRRLRLTKMNVQTGL